MYEFCMCLRTHVRMQSPESTFQQVYLGHSTLHGFAFCLTIFLLADKMQWNRNGIGRLWRTGHNDSIQCTMVSKCWAHTHAHWTCVEMTFFKCNNTLLTIHYLVIDMWKRNKCVCHEVKPSLSKLRGKKESQKKHGNGNKKANKTVLNKLRHTRVSRVTLFWFLFHILLKLSTFVWESSIRCAHRLNIHMNHWLACFNAGTTAKQWKPKPINKRVS